MRITITHADGTEQVVPNGALGSTALGVLHILDDKTESVLDLRVDDGGWKVTVEP